jgi:glycosyltransferase involved in cell wall biosynthesis
LSKKRILFLSSWYPSKNNPNLGNFVQRHAEAANEHSEVTALFITSTPLVNKLTIEKETINGVETYIAYYPKINSGIPVLNKLRKYNTYLKVAKLAYARIGKEFDLAHLNIAYPAGLFALWLKKKKKLSYVLTEQWTGYLQIKGDFKKTNTIQKSQHYKIFKSATRIYPVSYHLGQALKAHGLLKTYEVLHNVVNHEVFYPEENEEGKFRFIHISTFDDAHKNISGMFRVFQQMNKDGLDFEIHIVTEGNKEKVEEIAKQYEIKSNQLIIDCSLDQKGVASALRKSDCLVLFSNYETFSVVLAEAWLTGIPCVYSKCGGLTEIDNNDIGIQVPIKDETALFGALSKIVQQEVRFDKEKIVVFASDFKKDKIAEKMNELYSKALKKSLNDI